MAVDEPNGVPTFASWLARLPVDELMGMILAALDEVERREGRRPEVLYIQGAWTIVLRAQDHF